MATPEEQQIVDEQAAANAGTEAPTPPAAVSEPSDLAAAVADANADAVEPPPEGDAGEGGDVGIDGGEAPPEGDADAAPLPEEVVAKVRADFAIPETWTDANVLAWWTVVSEYPANEEGHINVQSETGVFYLDPTRADRVVSAWSTDELLAFVSGKLIDSDTARNGQVVTELRNRISVPAAWSVKEVLAFYGQGIEPEKTSNGVYKTDISRANRGPSDWTTAELEAWALGEISAAGKTGDAKAAVELRSRLSLRAENNSPAAVRAAYVQLQADTPAAVMADLIEAPVAEVPAVIANIEKVEGLNAMNVSFIDGTLERYAAAVAVNKPITEADAIKAQGALENLFQYAIQQEPAALVASLKRILAFFAKNQEKTHVFHSDNVMRFTHLLRAERNYRERHVNFLELLRAYSAPNTDLRKQVDVRRLVRDQQADRIEMLVEFFQKYA